jgi:hypothetical protein
MQAISGVMQSILAQLIMVSMHIDMHIPQSSIHRHIVFISHFISIAILFSLVWNAAPGLIGEPMPPLWRSSPLVTRKNCTLVVLFANLLRAHARSCKKLSYIPANIRVLFREHRLKTS